MISLVRRSVYTLNPDTNRREVVGEFQHADVNLTLCDEEAGNVYPDPEGRLRYMHAFQMTENYIALLETSYMFNPCSTGNHNNNSKNKNCSHPFQLSFTLKIIILIIIVIIIITQKYCFID